MKSYERYDATSERIYVDDLEGVPLIGVETYDCEPEALVPLYLDCESGRFFFYQQEARDLDAIEPRETWEVAPDA